MRKVLVWLLKVLCAGVIALFMLSVFSSLYYNNGIRKTSETGATDYSWENRFWSLGYEGYAWGNYDKDGFNNLEWEEGDRIDILLMGSSHMNAYNVSSKYSTAYLLNTQMKESELNYNVYNIGMEGHDFFACSDNLDDALAAYNPTKYVIMETRYARMSIDSMEEVLNETRVRAPAFDSGMIYYLQKIPYFRLFHRQLRDMLAANSNTSKDLNNTELHAEETSAITYEYILDAYMEKLAGELNDKGVTLIIFFMPEISINQDGSISKSGTSEDLELLLSSCQKHNIEFVDLSDTFIKHYEQTYELPFGFSNTRIGEGHLNRTGHVLIADKLFETILEIEGK